MVAPLVRERLRHSRTLHRSQANGPPLFEEGTACGGISVFLSFKTICVNRLLARLRRDYNPHVVRKFTRKMLRILAGGRLPPLREREENRCRKCEVFAKKRIENGIKYSNIFSQQSPVFGQNPFTGMFYIDTNKTLQTEKHISLQGSFYYNVKTIKCSFWFSLRRGGNLPPAKTATPFSLILPHNVRNIIAAKPRS